MSATTCKASSDAIVHPKHSGIRITSIVNKRGADSFGESYLVTVPSRVTGAGRTRKQFPNLQSAKAWATDQYQGTRQLGHDFLALAAAEQRECVEGIKRLKEHGITITQAIDYAIHRMRPEGGDRTVEQVVGEILASRDARGKTGQLRPESVRTFGIRARRFRSDFNDTMVKDITPAGLKDWIQALGCSTRTNRNYIDVVREVFRFAEQRKYVGTSPLSEWTDDDHKELVGSTIAGVEAPGILTVTEANRLLKAALLHPDLDLLGAITLGLFCGVRTEELTRLNWSNVKMNAEEPYVTIPATVAKKRRIRQIPIPDNAMTWLRLCPNHKGSLTRQDFETDYRKRFQRLLKVAGFTETGEDGKVRTVWTRNSVRHSFGSYHYALHGDSMLTSRLLGHRSGDEVLFAHYRDLTSKTKGEKYFAMVPPKTAGKIIALPKAESA